MIDDLIVINCQNVVVEGVRRAGQRIDLNVDQGDGGVGRHLKVAHAPGIDRNRTEERLIGIQGAADGALDRIIGAGGAILFIPVIVLGERGWWWVGQQIFGIVGNSEILKNILHQKIKCPQTLWLTDLIIDNSNKQIPVHDYFDGDDLFTSLRRRGLPIGNLTSQFFANVYLNDFDHFVKEKLKIKKYIRYVDDFAFFSNDHLELTQVRQSIENYLATLRLKIHPIKSQIFSTKQGANFLGFRIFPTHTRVRCNNLRLGKKRICLLKQAVAIGKISASTANLSILSWFAHLAHGDTWQLRSHICFSVKHCKAVKYSQI